jgi:hypothetical protein
MILMSSSIQYIPHHQIDKQQWNNCIANASNGLIYARTEFLDIMSPNWDALVYGDYKAIMPITWRKKLGIKYICQPAFCQQLGVFYIDEQYQQFVPDFLRKLAVSFRLIEINVNYSNQPENTNQLTNYVLSLAGNYPSLYSNLSARFIQSIKRSARYPMEYICDKNPSEIIEEYKQAYSDRIHIRQQDFEQFNLLCSQFIEDGMAVIRSARQPDGTLLAATILLKDEKRLYNVINVISGNGRTLEANYFLYNKILEEFAGTGLLLDFEGSDLPGVAKFYQKFNPINQPYFFWKSNRLPAVLRWWKK